MAATVMKWKMEGNRRPELYYKNTYVIKREAWLEFSGQNMIYAINLGDLTKYSNQYCNFNNIFFIIM
jgi:hypothetical protein